MRLHQSRTVTAAITAMLEGAGLTVGAGEQPAGTGWQSTAAASQFIPYVVVYPMAGGRLDGAIGDGQEDATVRYQLTCVGASQAQAEWVADTARVAMLGTPPAVTGRTITLIVADDTGGCMRDDAVQPPLWFVPDRYQLLTTPT